MQDSDYLNELDEMTGGIKKNLMKMRRSFRRFDQVLNNKEETDIQGQTQNIMIEEVSLLKNYLYKLNRSTENKVIFDDLVASQQIKKTKGQKPKPKRVRKQKPQEQKPENNEENLKKQKDLRYQKFKCQFCDMENTTIGLAYHMKQKHGVKKYYRCPVCQCIFSDASILAKHIRDHNPLKRLQFVCPFYEQVFYSASILAKHISWAEGYHQFISLKEQPVNKQEQKSDQNIIID